MILWWFAQRGKLYQLDGGGNPYSTDAKVPRVEGWIGERVTRAKGPDGFKRKGYHPQS